MLRFKRMILGSFVLLLCSTARSQDPHWDGGPTLLRSASVLDELGLTADKKQKVSSGIRSIFKSHQQSFRDVQQATEEDKKQEIRDALAKALNKDTDEMLAGILSAEQRTRYDQLAIQIRGPSGLLLDGVRSKLKLSDDQVKNIEAARVEMRTETSKVQRASRSDPKAGLKKMDEVRQAALEKAVNLLNDDQKKSWTGLTGKPFAFLD